MSLPALLFLAVGFVLLTAGAHALVQGAVRIAARLGIPSLVVGLTVVAFGTSAPEVAVSVQASLAGNAPIAVGNVVGSNIFNVLFILGVSALITPLVVERRLVRYDVPILIGVSALPLLLGLGGRLGRGSGVLLLAGGTLYTAALFVLGRGNGPGDGADRAPPPQDASGAEASAAAPAAAPSPAPQPPADAPAAGSIFLDLVVTGVGLALLVLGSRWLVRGAVLVAEGLGVSQLVIGLTIVAAGTSLPEVATSVMASLRGERDIAVGNVVGSNVFNVLIVLGAAATVSSDGLAISPGALSFDLPLMFFTALALLPVVFTGSVISRWEGGVFLAYYVVYVVYLALDAAGHDAEPVLTGVMLGFVLPITVLTLAVVVVREVRGR